MHTTGSENAMTEIALALAMGFFSLMVLTLISFGTPEGVLSQTQSVSVATPAEGDAAGMTGQQADDLVIILHQGDFIDINKNPLSIDRILAHPGRVTLAINPATSLESVIEARGQLAHPNLIITQLDAEWVSALIPNAGPVQ